MKSLQSILFLLFAATCFSPCTAAVSNLDDLPPIHPVRSEKHLLEILHYASLWYYDRSFVTAEPERKELDILYRQTTRDLDKDDKSVFGELWIPLVNMLIEIEKSDYPIQELGIQVVDDAYKVRRVVRIDKPPVPLAEYKRHTITFDRLREWYADNIRVAEPLSEALRERLRKAVLAHPFLEELSTTENTIFHVAPVSPACDELWIFHENNKQLLLFSSDMDLSKEAYWEIMPIHLKVYDLDPELILAPDEQAHGTARLSKDFVGRALFNCVVLGRRVEVAPEKVDSNSKDNASKIQ